MITSDALTGAYKEVSTTYWTVAIIEIMHAGLSHLMHGNGPCGSTYLMWSIEESCDQKIVAHVENLVSY